MVILFRAFLRLWHRSRRQGARPAVHTSYCTLIKAGRVSQWLEQAETPAPIGRPGQVYAGATERDCIPGEWR
jgi:hypothetical protein